jgi:transcriptional regulator with GAF, ATPase, and Fis domain
MTDGRERQITEAFVSLASSLANGFDVVDLLSSLTADCAGLLDVASAGLLLSDRQGVLHLVAASSDETRNLELFQLQREQGPCLDCFHQSASVTVENLVTEAARWPQFAEAALTAGFRSVHALPMRLREKTLGTLGLFGTTVGALNPKDLTLGQALADVASVAIIQDRAANDQEMVNKQLQGALQSRIVIEQAKGILAEHGGIDMNAAFAMLRRHARDNNLRLNAVATSLVERRLDPDQLLADTSQATQLHSR